MKKRPVCRHCMTPSRLGQDHCDLCGHPVGRYSQNIVGTGAYEHAVNAAKQVASGRSMRLYRYRFVLLALMIFVLGYHLILVPSDWPILFVPVSIGLIIYLGTRKP